MSSPESASNSWPQSMPVVWQDAGAFRDKHDGAAHSQIAAEINKLKPKTPVKLITPSKGKNRMIMIRPYGRVNVSRFSKFRTGIEDGEVKNMEIPN